MTGDKLVRRLRRQRNAQRMHRLGDRALFEFVDELIRRYPTIGADIDRRLARYAALDPAMLQAVGDDRFPAPPLRAVGVGR